MRRTIAGLRAARTRLDEGVRAAGIGVGLLLVAACGPAAEEPAIVAAATTATTEATTEATGPTPSATPSATPSPTPSATPSATPSPTAAATTAAPTPNPTPVRVAVPGVAGLSPARAAARLATLGLRTRTVLRRTTAAAAGTVLGTSPGTGSPLARGTVVTLTVAQAPPPPPRTTPPPPPEPSEEASIGCHPSYSGCLRADASDYDCAGGSGNGPLYTGRVTVVGPDEFDLDRDGDGIGCERD